MANFDIAAQNSALIIAQNVTNKICYDMAVFCEEQNALICNTGNSNKSVVLSATSIVAND